MDSIAYISPDRSIYVYSNNDGHYWLPTGYGKVKNAPITAFKKDYYPQTKKFSVAPGETVTVNFDLQPKRGEK